MPTPAPGDCVSDDFEGPSLLGNQWTATDAGGDGNYVVGGGAITPKAASPSTTSAPKFFFGALGFRRAYAYVALSTEPVDAANAWSGGPGVVRFIYHCGKIFIYGQSATVDRLCADGAAAVLRLGADACLRAEPRGRHWGASPPLRVLRRGELRRAGRVARGERVSGGLRADRGAFPSARPRRDARAS